MKTIAITGATGFLGQALIPFLIENYHPKTIRLLGRSEFKLAQIIRGENLKYDLDQFRPMICDIRDRERVFSCLKDADLVIHTAALKRLEICNYNPQEAIKTNVVGSMNVMDACINVGVKKAVFISSDKAVNACNLYGRTKAVMESMVIERARMLGNNTPIMCVVRYGNVIGSTGAVIPYFIKLAKEGKALPITDAIMTRFLLTKKEALNTVKRTIDEGNQSEIIVPNDLKAMGIIDIATSICDYIGKPYEFVSIGSWPGEKLHEEISEGNTSDKARQVENDEFISMLKEEGLL